MKKNHLSYIHIHITVTKWYRLYNGLEQYLNYGQRKFCLFLLSYKKRKEK